jgi:hypothetical protein
MGCPLAPRVAEGRRIVAFKGIDGIGGHFFASSIKQTRLDRAARLREEFESQAVVCALK